MVNPSRHRRSAEERHEEILAVARRLFAQRGYFGTPTVEIAKAAGLSHGYMFRLIGTKEALFTDVVRDCFGEIISVLRSAAGGLTGLSPQERLSTIGVSYADVLARRDLLLIQLHAAAACTEPAIRQAVREGYASIVELLRDLSGAEDADIQQVMAVGMLTNVIAALGADTIDEPWARTLVGDLVFKPVQ